jgi:hypothetical protein
MIPESAFALGVCEADMAGLILPVRREITCSKPQSYVGAASLMWNQIAFYYQLPLLREKQHPTGS